MKNGIKYNLMAAVSFMVLSLSSCVKKEIYDTPHPGKGAVLVTADWSEALSETDIPQTYSLCIDNGNVYHSEKLTFCYPELLSPGKYDLLVYNEPDGITFDGTTAYVDSYTDGMLVALPKYLFSATQELDVVKDDTLRVTVPMKRRLIPVLMNISLDGENAGKVVSVEATLSGVSGSVNLETGETGNEPKTVKLDVKLIEPADGSNDGRKIELSCRIFGVCAGQKQILTVKLTNDDGYESSITSDVSESLEDIVTDGSVEMDGSVEAAQDGHFSGTIDNWEQVSSDDVEAN